jgi:hypothetical protein
MAGASSAGALIGTDHTRHTIAPAIGNTAAAPIVNRNSVGMVHDDHLDRGVLGIQQPELFLQGAECPLTIGRPLRV